jgi:uncharacterized protein YjbJ (UPF0337 family)
MNADVLQGKWTELRGKVHERWGDLTNDDLDKINGQREQLTGMLQQRYGYAKDRAEMEIDRFLAESNKN